MPYQFDPRGDLPPPTIQPTTYMSGWSPEAGRRDYHRRIVHNYQAVRPKRRPCYDWIFSSGSDAHVAVDRSSFRTYTAFKSYVLTVADARQVTVRGVGTVDLKIRSQPGTKESHLITLENVLHIPGWLCNIFSDIYFVPSADFEHTWTEFGVSFLRKENGMMRYWGFTENFCDLDKLVLSRDLQGRSPMLEDADREVFSVNVRWPQGQRDRWEAYQQTEQQREIQRQEMVRDARSGLSDMTSLSRGLRGVSSEIHREPRSGLTDLGANTMLRRGLSTRTSSLKARVSLTLSNREPLN